MAGDGGAGGEPAGVLFRHRFVGQVILVDVADVLDGFGADFAGSDEFDIVEPTIRVVTLGSGHAPQFFYSIRPGVVRSQGEESLW